MDRMARAFWLTALALLLLACDGDATARAHRFAAQPSPARALSAYIDVLRDHNKDPSLGLYTPQTRSLLAGRAMSDGQQALELRVLAKHHASMRIAERGDVAVAAFPASAVQAPPYLLRRGPDGWMLDLASMGRVIGFDQANRWYFRGGAGEFSAALAAAR
jgi:hypothetical protein